MTTNSAATAAAATTTRAYATIDDLMARVGVDGLTAALTNPGLLAAVDQQAASVRESIRRSRRQLSLEALASYAGSVTAAVHRGGRRLPEPGEAVAPALDWDTAPRYLLRLVAVCAIAEQAGWL